MKTPEVKTLDEAAEYLRNNNLELIIEAAEEGAELGVNEKLETRDPFKPNLLDLCRLHRLVIENKRTTVLEFGTGWSTLVLADALWKLKSIYSDDVKDLRRNNLFELHVVDDEAEFISIAASRLPDHLREITNFSEKSAVMGTFNGRICTYYELIPHVSPDFIYVDGPNQFSIKSDVSGWSTRHKDMMPMSGDLLRVEHYLTPGTILVFDGRAANARFFKCNVQRDWDYQYDADYDQHIFLLNEAPLGKYNKRQLDFYQRP